MKIIYEKLLNKTNNYPFCIKQEIPNNEFIFGDYIVKKSTEYSILCEKNEKMIWSFKHGVSFLYTNIIKRNGIILFGTSGNGGHFYALKLNTGEIVCDINNRGCEHFGIKGSAVYLKNNNGNLICVNPIKNIVLEELKLKNKMDYYSPIFIKGNKLNTIVNNLTDTGAWGNFFELEIEL
jgi:outer membrane protein assembly factor BamB